ncbi:MAG: AAA family ATPase, partial [Planctomycetes bacterium]|nr:AAA family ATPase [Planctomycetota bacterium]
MSVFKSLPRAPLAERMRPRTFEEYVGQEHLVGEGRLIRRAIEEDSVSSMLLWGPPGSGKTALARVIASVTKREFVTFSAVLQGVKEVREIIATARERLDTSGVGTILFVDEIHRFNKAQQDAFLPHVEAGTIVLVGATTENPSFEVNRALQSRCRTYMLKPLTDENIAEIIDRAIGDKDKGIATMQPLLSDEAYELLVNYSNGDARTALNALELAVNGTAPNEDGIREVTLETMKDAISSRVIAYDKGGEEFYNLISAMQKSIRG